MKKDLINISLIVVWMVIIFWFSNQPGNISSQESGTILNIVNGFGITKLINPDILHLIIRKLGHVFIYLVLGLLVYNFYKDKGITSFNKIFLSVLICYIYATTDEIHQLLVPGRSGMYFDIVLDTLSSLVGIFTFNHLKKK